MDRPNASNHAYKMAILTEDPIGSRCKHKDWMNIVRKHNDGLKTLYRDYVLSTGIPAPPLSSKMSQATPSKGLTETYSYGIKKIEDEREESRVKPSFTTDDGAFGISSAQFSKASTGTKRKRVMTLVGLGTHGDDVGDSDDEPVPAVHKQDTDGTTSGPARKSRAVPRVGLKKGEGVSDPRPPGVALKKFTTARYEVFDWTRHEHHSPEDPGRYNGSYTIYDNFKLLTGDLPDYIGIGNVPHRAVRLDDRWVAMAAASFTNTQLTQNFPAEFDSNGMLRATRMPLGDPCLIWAHQGHEDIDKNQVRESGLFYGWYRGLQILCGKEGFEEYMVRPSFEKLKCSKIGFKVGYPAPGDRSHANGETALVDGKTVVCLG